ncbi:MAG: class I SAM-dependent methyltransferase [Sterolibacterium sp.]
MIFEKVTMEDFAEAFGVGVADVPEECRSIMNDLDFSYRVLAGAERDALILEALKKNELDRQEIGAAERRNVWQEGWNQNLQEFVSGGHDLRSLVPKFIRPGRPIRLNREYVVPVNPMFELDYFRVFREWLFRTYFGRAKSVYEFGCGTGFNLVELARLYPETQLYGLDFVPASSDLVNQIAKAYNLKMVGRLFDMTAPDESLLLDTDSAIFTFGSVEQLAGRFENFLQFLLRRSPAFCVHLEPIVELYEEDNLLDYLAIKFHKKRGYTEGLLPRLRELEAAGRVEVLKVKRLFFGSTFMEGFSYVIWKPRKES